MQEFSLKRLLKTKNKSFFNLSVYQFLGIFGVLESDIKKLDLYNHWCEVSRGSGVLPIMKDNGEKFSRIYINTGK
ncbi:hypothetical protein G6W42_00395 [Campylobacter concisus]|uniref:hypothetical protein n=1 Tax=Campylobacter concisus TaxID=199 RepID=UPI00188355D6|nr:hypothetical protein [Campylobacter concisus]MBE9851104.1 hypothetical protein [Campylobacter concisus]